MRRAGRKARVRRINLALSHEVVRAFSSWENLVDRVEAILTDREREQLRSDNAPVIH